MMENIIDREKLVTDFTTRSELIGDIQLSDLPDIINSQVVEINDLGKKIESAIKKAESAKQKAFEAEKLKYKIGHRGEMVTTIRDVTVKVAESQSETTEALNLTFKNEKKLGDISKHLFALGMYSLAHTEAVIQQLSDELKEEGKGEKLSDIAKQRLREVIEQLEAQKKIKDEQSILKNKAEEFDVQISGIKEEVEQMNTSFEERLEIVSGEVKSAIGQIKDEIEMHKVDVGNKIEKLEQRLSAIDVVMSKKAWKIVVSAVAASSFLLNILQITGII